MQPTPHPIRPTAIGTHRSKTRPRGSTPCNTAGPCNAKRRADQDVDMDEGRSTSYSKQMQLHMGSPLQYRHELGINYTLVAPGIIVGSCLQSAEDVDHLADAQGVSLIFCLQEDSDLAYWSLQGAFSQIQRRCEQRGDIKHVRHPIRDFDPLDLRRRLPQAIAQLASEHQQRPGTIYIHCTAGLGRAPAAAVAYMAWVRGVPVDTAMQQLRSVRPCNPRIEAVRSATADLLLGNKQIATTIAVQSHALAKSVQVAGLDHGWQQPHMDMTWDSGTQRFLLKRHLYPGSYKFKMVVDGRWLHTNDYPTVQDGHHVNNTLEVLAASDPELEEKRLHYSSPGIVLTQKEQQQVRKSLGVHETLDHPTGRPMCIIM